MFLPAQAPFRSTADASPVLQLWRSRARAVTALDCVPAQSSNTLIAVQGRESGHGKALGGWELTSATAWVKKQRLFKYPVMEEQSSIVILSDMQGKESSHGQALGGTDSAFEQRQGLGEASTPQGQQDPRVTPHPAYDPNVRTPAR